jgi:hypothetical protein
LKIKKNKRLKLTVFGSKNLRFFKIMDYDFDHKISFYLKPILFGKNPKTKKILETKLNIEELSTK